MVDELVGGPCIAIEVGSLAACGTVSCCKRGCYNCNCGTCLSVPFKLSAAQGMALCSLPSVCGYAHAPDAVVLPYVGRPKRRQRAGRGIQAAGRAEGPRIGACVAAQHPEGTFWCQPCAQLHPLHRPGRGRAPGGQLLLQCAAAANSTGTLSQGFPDWSRVYQRSCSGREMSSLGGLWGRVTQLNVDRFMSTRCVSA